MKFLLLFAISCVSVLGQGWTQLTNTAIQANASTNSVCPPDSFPSTPSGAYNSLCYTKIDAWVGAVPDTKRNRLLILMGGGHSASPGNENYSLDLQNLSTTTATDCTLSPNGCRTNATVPTMTRLNDPSNYSDSPTFNADGTPWASHTFGNGVYLPRSDKVISLYNGTYPQGPDTRLFLWNASTAAWADALPVNANFEVVSGGTGCTNGVQNLTFSGGTGGTGQVNVVGGVPVGSLVTVAAGSGYSVVPTSVQVATCTGATTVKGGGVSAGAISTIPGNDGAYCALDTTQSDEAVLCVAAVDSAVPAQLFRWDITTNTLTELIAPHAFTWQQSPYVVVDPDRRLLLSFGNDFEGTPTTDAKLLVTDLSDPSYTTTDWSSTLVGCNDLLQNGYPGVQWDPSIHKIVGYVPRRQYTSTTSVTVPVSFPATVNMTTATGGTFPTGALIVVEETSAYDSVGFAGTVASYNSGTGALSITVPTGSPIAGLSGTTFGSGTHSDWIINVQYNTIVVFNPATRSCTIDPNSGLTGPTPDYAMLALGRGMFGRFSYFPALGEYVVVTSFASDAWTFKLSNTPTNGLGSSSLYCVDRDGDGYGTGAVKIGAFSDLVIDGSNNKIVSSASHTFTAADLNKPIQITGGSGFTLGDNPVVSVAAGKATLLNAAGTVSSTGGSWLIPGCLGPDADDLDASVWTTAQYLSKWTDIPTGLKHQGYNPANIWYVSPTGNDGTGVVNDAAHPFLTCCGAGKANPVAGDALMPRGGTYANFFEFNGSVGLPAYFLAYPGETPLFIAGSGTPCTSPTYRIYDGLTYNNSGGTADIGCSDSVSVEFKHIYAIGDEWQIEASATPSTGQMTDFTIEDSALGWNWAGGCGSNQHAVYITHHNPSNYSTNIFVRRNLLAESCYNGLQMNGRFKNAVVEQNISYGNDVGGFAWLSGVSNSTLRSNLSFNNDQTAFNFFDYPDFCAVYGTTGIGVSCPYDQTNNLIENNTFYSTGASPIDGSSSTSSPSVGVTNAQGYVLSGTSHTIGTGSAAFTLSTWAMGTTYQGNDIVIFSGNYYVALDPSTGSQPDTHPADWGLIGASTTAFWSNGDRIRVCPNLSLGAACSNTTANWEEGLVTSYVGGVLTINIDTVVGSGTFSNWVVNLNRIGNLGGNTFQNNVLVSYSPGSAGTGFPQFRYDENTYTTTSTYKNNVFYNLYPTAGSFTNVIQTVFEGITTYYTCAQMIANSGTVFGSASNCTNADPLLTASSPNYWNTPSSFNFALTGSSPAVHAGTSSMAAPFDVFGSAFSATTPSIGAVETAAGTSATQISGTIKISGPVSVH